MAKRGLGKGFESLIPSELIELATSASDDFSHSRPIKIQDIIASPNQPRKSFNDQAMQELIDSIAEHGVLQPIMVVKDGGNFRLVAGERRWRATKHLGLETIPAIVRSLDEQQKVEIALIENLQREDLNPLEIAETLFVLSDKFNVTGAQLAKRVGKAKTTISNIMRLLNLPDTAKRALETGKISEGHGRAILALAGDGKRQQQLLDYILKHGWSVRQAEQFVDASKSKTVKNATESTLTTDKTTEALTKKLKTKAPVRIQRMAKGRGRIIIEFKDSKEYRAIAKKLV